MKNSASRCMRDQVGCRRRSRTGVANWPPSEKLRDELRDECAKRKTLVRDLDRELNGAGLT